MAVDTSPRSTTWTHVDGEWLPGNPPLIGPTSHAMWLGSTVFDAPAGSTASPRISTCTASASTAQRSPWA